MNNWNFLHFSGNFSRLPIGRAWPRDLDFAEWRRRKLRKEPCSTSSILGNEDPNTDWCDALDPIHHDMSALKASEMRFVDCAECKVVDTENTISSLNWTSPALVRVDIYFELNSSKSSSSRFVISFHEYRHCDSNHHDWRMRLLSIDLTHINALHLVIADARDGQDDSKQPQDPMLYSDPIVWCIIAIQFIVSRCSHWICVELFDAKKYWDGNPLL